jgi:hypothetical protein
MGLRPQWLGKARNAAPPQNHLPQRAALLYQNQDGRRAFPRRDSDRLLQIATGFEVVEIIEAQAEELAGEFFWQRWERG